MLARSRERILASLDDGASVLDVGGWARPLARADWVIDVMPYETRGIYGEPDPEPERFDASRWVRHDICDRRPWPFGGGEFDFAVCSHTLEDVRDPVWVCSELVRVARRGYIEVPSRLEEQAFGVQGPWVGYSHHRWLVDVGADGIEFVSKPGALQGRRDMQLSTEAVEALSEDERVQTLFWEGGFAFRERFFEEVAELDAYLIEAVRGRPHPVDPPPPAPGIAAAIRARLRQRSW